MQRTLHLIPAILLCTVLSAQAVHDARIMEFKGLKFACDNGALPILKIINDGSETMTGCVVETWKNGLIVNTFDWQLAVPAAQGQIRQPAFPVVSGVTASDLLEFRIISVNTIPDEVAAGNSLQIQLDQEKATSPSNTITVKVETDEVIDGSRWEIRNELGVLVASGGPYEDPDAEILIETMLNSNGCYEFKAFDPDRDVVPGTRFQVLSGSNVIMAMDGAAVQAGYAKGLTTGSGSTCTEPLSVELRTDASPEGTQWEVYDQNSGAVVCTGAGGYPSEVIVQEACCLPQGCYKLRVLDTGGDGYTGGGYVLRGTPTQRIIDNAGNAPSGSVSAIAGGQGFCLPLGIGKLTFATCDKLDWVANRYLVASEISAVSGTWVPNGANNVQPANSGYEFWIFDPNGSYSFRRFRSHNVSDGVSPANARRACHMKINSWLNTPLTPHVPTNKLLNVRVRGRVSGTDLEFGTACTMRLDPVLAACPQVRLQDDPSSPSNYSCGVPKVFGGVNSSANRIVAAAPQFTPAVVSGNVRYQFRFRVEGEIDNELTNPWACIIRPPQTSPTLYLNWTTGQKLQCSTQYQVDVRVSKDGGATWCTGGATNDPAHCNISVTPWGRVCNVDITTSPFCPGELTGGTSNLAGQEGELTLYPNPNNGDQVFINLTALSADVTTVSVDIYNMGGQRIGARMIAVQDGVVNTRMELDGARVAGVYMVRVAAGSRSWTERLLIQPSR